jgi:DNA-binding MarR family transcriptional regulator
MNNRRVAQESVATDSVVLLPCTCTNLRRAARIVSQLYDRELRQAGLRVTQFALLQALVRAKDISQGKLGEVLGLDSTTLTRTLALLRK